MAANLLNFETISNSSADAVQSAGSITVLVNARRRMPASGIVYANDLILTANHAVEREEDATILTPDGHTLQASLAGRDPARDIALLKLQAALPKTAVPASKPARVGQLVLAVARPDDSGLQASLGVIGAIGGPVRTSQGGLLDQYIRTDTQALPGFSGGPLVCGNGEILGMNTSGLAMGSLITIPAGLLWTAAASLAAHGHIRRPYLGIRSQNVKLGSAQQSLLDRSQENALLLVGIEEDSPAAVAGLMVGDILVTFNSQPLKDHDELQLYLKPELAGQPAAVELLRGGQKLDLTVKLEER